MLKKSLMFFIVVFLAGILILGCSNPTGPAGKDGEPGTPGTGSNGSSSGNSGGEQSGGSVTLPAGTYHVSTLQNLITKNSDIYVVGAVQLDETGTVIIPAGKTLVLDAAITLATNITLIIEPGVTLGGATQIITTNGVMIAEPAVLTAKAGGTGSKVPLQTSGTIVPDATFAVLGNVTISDGDTSQTNIKTTDFSSNKKLYVVGNLTVNAAVNTTGGLIATGDVITTAAITAPVTAKTVAVNTGGSITGAVTTTGTVTTDVVDAITGAVDAGGKVTFTAAQAGIAALTAGSLEAAALTTSGAVTITGAATITGAFAPAAAVSFGGLTSITGEVAPTANIVLSGTGAVTLGAIDTSSGTITFKNTHANGVILSAPSTALTTGNLVATAGVAIKGDSTTGVAIGGASLTVAATSSIVASTGSIVGGGSGNTVTITGATLGEGTYAGAAGGLTLTTKGDITVADGGAVTLAGTGTLTLSEANTKIVLLAGGSLSAAIGSDIIDSSHAEVKLTVGKTATPTVAAKATVVGSTPTWTVTEDTTADTGNAGTPVVGKIQWTITGTTAVSAQIGANASSDAAGTLTAGTGTTITITGT
jgi:filamentous hemagglutinin